MCIIFFPFFFMLGYIPRSYGGQYHKITFLADWTIYSLNLDGDPDATDHLKSFKLDQCMTNSTEDLNESFY